MPEIVEILKILHSKQPDSERTAALKKRLEKENSVDLSGQTYKKAYLAHQKLARAAGKKIEEEPLDVTDMGFETLVKLVQRDEKIRGEYEFEKSLEFSDFLTLAQVLKDNINITSLNISHPISGWTNMLAWDKAPMALVNALETNNTLTSLDISGSCEYGISERGRGIDVLIRILTKNTTLTHLGFQDNDIGNKNLERLASALANNHSLTSLDLRYNKLGDEGAELLAVTLENNPTLTNLSLAENRIGEKGIKRLATALEKNEKLTDLNLEGNTITDQNLSDLTRALEKNKTLKSLGITLEQSSLMDAFLFTTLLGENSRLTSLDLMGSSFSIETITKLASILETTQTLTSLNLRECRLSAEAIKILAAALKKNQSLIHLNLGSNNIDASGFEVLASALEENHTIINLGDLDKEPTMSEEIFEHWQMAINTHLEKNIKRREIISEELDKHLLSGISDTIRDYLNIPRKPKATRSPEAIEREKVAQQTKFAMDKATQAAMKSEEAAEKAKQAAARAMAATKITEESIRGGKVKAEENVIPNADTVVKNQAEINEGTQAQLQALQVQQQEQVTTQAAASSKPSSALQTNRLRTAAGVCFMLAVIVTPILFIFATPLAASLVLGALLAASTITFGLSKYANQKSAKPNIPQVMAPRPPQEASPSSEDSAKQLSIQTGLNTSLGTQGPSIDPQKQRRPSR